MRREYVKPVMQSEEFVANEYVAACWTIHCNVPYGTGYLEKNGQAGLQKEGNDPDRKLVEYAWGCNAKHEAHGIDAEGPKANAYWVTENGKILSVFYFHANGNKSDSNHHFCTLDDGNIHWEKNKNASN